MKKIVCLLVTAVLLITVFTTINSATKVDTTVIEDEEKLATTGADQYENGYRYNIQGWVYVYLEGDPYDRGFQHGYLLAEEIDDLITRWSNMIHNHKRIQPLNKLISQEKYDRISEIYWNFCKN